MIFFARIWPYNTEDDVGDSSAHREGRSEMSTRTIALTDWGHVPGYSIDRAPIICALSIFIVCPYLAKLHILMEYLVL